MRIIYPGGDDELFRPDIRAGEAFRERFGFAGLPLLLSVGSITPRKAQEIMVRALARLDGHDQLHYAIAGLPLAPDTLRREAIALGVADRLHILGPISDAELVGAYNACDLFVMPSRHSPDGDFEGFGIVVVEAALCGKPALVTSESGLQEAIEEDITGLTFPIDDAASAARQLARFFSDDGLRQRMGERARERALEGFTWSRTAARYDDLLRATAARGR